MKRVSFLIKKLFYLFLPSELVVFLLLFYSDSALILL